MSQNVVDQKARLLITVFLQIYLMNVNLLPEHQPTDLDMTV